ncbi:MAG: phage holin family protein [Candidatus Daviesbacteria bacterium]|nr:phage holin family protein [Candidatus Daviesbacteria bacterium]
MKSVIRNYLINLGALWVTTQVLPAISIVGGAKGLFIGALAFMIANILLVPLLKILLLPLNLLTLGLFAWLSNVLALYFLVNVVPYFRVSPYSFSGIYWQGFSLPAVDLTVFQVVIIASLLLGFIIHFSNWLVK